MTARKRNTFQILLVSLVMAGVLPKSGYTRDCSPKKGIYIDLYRDADLVASVVVFQESGQGKERRVVGGIKKLIKGDDGKKELKFDSPAVRNTDTFIPR